MGNGRTRPCLLAALPENGGDNEEEIEVVAKFSGGCERGTVALIAEAVAALLARDLGLPAQPPFQVVIPSGFAGLIPDASAAALFRTGGSLAFGSKFLGRGSWWCRLIAQFWALQVI